MNATPSKPRARNENRRVVDVETCERGLALATDRTHVLEVVRRACIVDVRICEDAPVVWDDRLTLQTRDGSWSQTLEVERHGQLVDAGFHRLFFDDFPKRAALRCYVQPWSEPEVPAGRPVPPVRVTPRAAEALCCRGSGLVCAPTPARHTIAAGETIESIAAQYELEPGELLAFNCGTTNQTIIDAYQRTTLRERGAGLRRGAAILIPEPIELHDREIKRLPMVPTQFFASLRIDCDPDELEYAEQTWVLESGDGTYRSVQTSADDADRRNDCLDFFFAGLLPGATYSLHVEVEAEREVILEGVPFDELIQAEF